MSIATYTYHIEQISDTYDNILANMDEWQIGFATDTFGSIGVADDLVMQNASGEHYTFAKQFKIASDDVTASYCSNNFGATTFHNTVTFINDTPEDADGGRESIIDFKGLQSGSEETTLGRIRFDHDGCGADDNDDQKGQMMIYINDGNDANSPSEVFRIEADGSIFAPLMSTATANGYYVYFNPTTKELFYEGS